jgi:hypothetical protein
VLLALLGLSWLPPSTYGLRLVLPLFWVAAIVLGMWWRTWFTLVVLLFSPVSAGALSGITDWFSTKPAFHGHGLPSAESGYNLDPGTRCYYRSGGCVVVGTEAFYTTPHNFALRAMIAFFGNPRNSYPGPFPSKQQAISLTDRVEVTAPEMFLQGTIRADGKDVSLGKELVEAITFDHDFPDKPLAGYERSARGVLLENECLLVRVKDRWTWPDGYVASDNDAIYLFDLKKKQPFARYIINGKLPRHARVFWYKH